MNRIFKPVIVHICNYMAEPENASLVITAEGSGSTYSVSHELGVKGMCETHSRVGASSQLRSGYRPCLAFPVM